MRGYIKIGVGWLVGGRAGAWDQRLLAQAKVSENGGGSFVWGQTRADVFPVFGYLWPRTSTALGSSAMKIVMFMGNVQVFSLS